MRKNVWIPMLIIGAAALPIGIVSMGGGLFIIFLLQIMEPVNPITPPIWLLIWGLAIGGTIGTILGIVLIAAGIRRRRAERAYDRAQAPP